MPQKLPHNLRNERRRASLTQEDIAALLGVESASKVSRYERWKTMPPLREALAYEAILGIPVRELFAGVFEDVRLAVWRRVSKRLRSTALYTRGVDPLRRRETLVRIAA